MNVRLVAALAALAIAVLVFAFLAGNPAPSATASPPVASVAVAVTTPQPSASASAPPLPVASATPALSASPQPATPSPTPTQAAGGPTPVPPSEPPPQSDLRITETGFTAFQSGGNDFASYGAILHNPDPDWSIVRMQVHVDFYDAADTFLAGQDVTITLRPGASLGIGGQVFGAGRAVRMEVVPPEDTVSYHQVSESNDTLVPKDVETRRINGSYLTTGTLASSFPTEQSFVEVIAVYRDVRGRIIGGSSGGAQTVPAGGTAPFEIVDGSPYQSVARTDVFWHEGL